MLRIVTARSITTDRINGPMTHMHRPTSSPARKVSFHFRRSAAQHLRSPESRKLESRRYCLLIYNTARLKKKKKNGDGRTDGGDKRVDQFGPLRISAGNINIFYYSRLGRYLESISFGQQTKEARSKRFRREVFGESFSRVGQQQQQQPPSEICYLVLFLFSILTRFFLHPWVNMKQRSLPPS